MLHDIITKLLQTNGKKHIEVATNLINNSSLFQEFTNLITELNNEKIKEIRFKKPVVCDKCRLGKLLSQPKEVSNDFSEAYYYCRILKKEVRGENAECTNQNWIDYFSNQSNYSVSKFYKTTKVIQKK